MLQVPKICRPKKQLQLKETATWCAVSFFIYPDVILQTSIENFPKCDIISNIKLYIVIRGDFICKRATKMVIS